MGKLHGGKRTRRTSYITWGVALVVFLIVELLGLERRRFAGLVPWWTASETVWATEKAVEGDGRSLTRRSVATGLRVSVLVLFVDLGVHLAFGTPLVPL